MAAYRLLYYNITMTNHAHSHGHHHHGHVHPPAAVSPSILRLPVSQRLSLAAALVLLLWLVAFWAMA